MTESNGEPEAVGLQPTGTTIVPNIHHVLLYWSTLTSFITYSRKPEPEARRVIKILINKSC